MFGLDFDCVSFCFFFATLAFFWASYLYLPKSKILHTGGDTFGEISTRSRPADSALSKASAILIIPIFSPFSSMSLTVSDVILSLTRTFGSLGLELYLLFFLSVAILSSYNFLVNRHHTFFFEKISQIFKFNHFLVF